MSYVTVSTFTSLVGVHQPSHEINNCQILEQSWCGQPIAPIGENQSLSKSSIYPFKIKSRPNQVQRDFSSHNFGTSIFSKGFQPTNFCCHKNSLVWTQVLLLRHRSQLTFSSTLLSSLSLVVVVASR